MKVTGVIVISVAEGEKVLVLLAPSRSELDQLYNKLRIDAYQFKKEVSEHHADIKFISAGFKDENGEFQWNDEYIPVPKWYENN